MCELAIIVTHTKTINNFTCARHLVRTASGLGLWRGAGCFQSSPERRAEPQNTVFKLRREAWFPLVYFNSDFYVRNTTWNADTSEHRVLDKRTWHMIRNLPCGNAARSPTSTLSQKAEWCGSRHWNKAHEPGTIQARKRTCGSSAAPIPHQLSY